MRFVLTGASGGGKSTLLAAVAEAGVQVVPEMGRAMVREASETGADWLPWDNPIGFRDEAFRRSIAAFDAHENAPGPVLFDRSFVEALSFGAPLPEPMSQALAARRFADPVLVCPPWPEIYVRDAERPKSFEAALDEYAREQSAYRTQGYRLVEVPKAPVVERVAFVLQHLAH